MLWSTKQGLCKMANMDPSQYGFVRVLSLLASPRSSSTSLNRSPPLPPATLVTPPVIFKSAKLSRSVDQHQTDQVEEQHGVGKRYSCGDLGDQVRSSVIRFRLVDLWIWGFVGTSVTRLTFGRTKFVSTFDLWSADGKSFKTLYIRSETLYRTWKCFIFRIAWCLFSPPMEQLCPAHCSGHQSQSITHSIKIHHLSHRQ